MVQSRAIRRGNGIGEIRMKSTVIIPQDKFHRHLMTIPIEIWKGEGLKEGDIIEIDIKKIKKSG